MRLPLIATLVALVAGATAAVGQEHATWDLQRVTAAALTHNQALNAARQQVAATQAGITQARAGMLPRIDLEETFSATNNPPLVFSSLLSQERFSADDFAINKLNHPDTLTNFNTRIRIEQPLFSGGRLWAGLDAAHQAVASSEQQLQRAEQATAFEAQHAYYSVLLADGNLATVERALEAARAHSATAGALFERGVVVRSDLLRAEVLVGTLERQRIDADNATHTARSRLAYVTGTADHFRLDERDAWQAPVQPPSLEESTALALRQRPDLQAAEHDWQRSTAALRQARGSYLPALGVIGQYDLNSEDFGDNGDSYAVFVGARWNLFEGGATSGRAAEAAAHEARARLLRDDLAARVRLEVEQAWRRLTAATRQVEVAERNQQQAEENLSIVRDRYGSGLARSVDVLDAVASAERTALDLLSARVSHQVGHAELRLATGQPTVGRPTEAP